MKVDYCLAIFRNKSRHCSDCTVTVYVHSHTQNQSKQNVICSTSSSPERLPSAACNSASFSEISIWALLISASALVCKSDKASWPEVKCKNKIGSYCIKNCISKN